MAKRRGKGEEQKNNRSVEQKNIMHKVHSNIFVI